MSLDDLIALINDPVKHFLRVRCGLSYWDSQRPSDEIPIELGWLERWGVGNRLLALARSGHPIDDVVRAEWLRGQVPPGALGTRVLDGLLAQVEQIVRALPAEASQAAHHHDIALDCGAVRLTGRVATQGELVLDAVFSKPSAKHTITLWLRLLALSATTDRPWRAMLVGRGGTRRLRGPDRQTATALLGRLVRLYRVGLHAPLPLPLPFGARLSGSLLDGRDPFSDRRGLDEVYKGADDRWRSFFPSVDELLAVPIGADDLDQPDDLLAFAAARLIWEPIGAHEVVAQ